MTRPIRLEMSRPVQVDRIPAGGSREEVTADAKELRSLEKRFGLPALHGLRATLDLARWRGNGVRITGTVTADIEQVCIVSLDPFRSELTEPVQRFFVPRSSVSGAPETVLDEAEIDIIERGVIDLGEMVSEIVALALDSYPKRPGVAFASPADPEYPAEEAAAGNPFAALEALKKRRN